ncbi:MAG: xanthine dehydrogenase family protein molybdopterin-binding subunit [Saprospiraceae bacterium]|nr:xanthine dehydrogenase family protein molybdopterin-binding subunit [Saprospiraceae bacterium]
MNRRHFFKITAMNGGGLVLSTFIPFACDSAETVLMNWEPNFFFRIGSDNTITFISSQSEIGQGTSTSLAMIAADELGARMEDIKIEFAPGSKERYSHLQDTGGSNGVRLLWQPLREAAATTREMLKMAAAEQWGVPVESCYVEEGRVLLRNSKRRLTFGQLVERASTLSAPRNLRLKDKVDFQYIGRAVIGPKTHQAARGITPYSMNVKLPDMLYAVIERCPVWGGSLQSFNASQAKAVPGVIEVIEMEGVAPDKNMDYKGGRRAGVAILAENTWAAMQAKRVLEVEWDLGKNATRSSQDLVEELNLSKIKTRKVTHDFKTANQKMQRTKSRIEASYFVPFQANACMEPLNATADHKGNRVEVWAGTQAPQLTRERVAEITNLPEGAITVYNCPSGGGFGRRYFCDYVEEAVVLSAQVRRPVKVVWTREDTIRTSKYHPLWTEYWEAALDANNWPIAMSYKGRLSRPGGYRPYPYSLPVAFHQGLNYQHGNLLPRASWRSVAAHYWGLGLECFIDELAVKAGVDPVEFRLKLLTEAEVVEQKFLPWVGDDLYPAKLSKTLEVVAEKAEWGKPREGIFQGVSAIAYNTSYCSMVADVSIEDYQVKVHKLTVAIDCGLAVNPSQVKNQVEGSIMWGLGAVLKPGITVMNGMVQQGNFDTYDLLRMKEAPEVEVHIIESEDPPSGIGEPAVPGVAPAVLNAIYAATGQRLRSIPVKEELQQLATI